MNHEIESLAFYIRLIKVANEYEKSVFLEHEADCADFIEDEMSNFPASFVERRRARLWRGNGAPIVLAMIDIEANYLAAVDVVLEMKPLV